MAVGALAVPAASADIIAAVDVPAGSSSGCPAQWDLRVGGHRLSRGTYLVTPRLLTRAGVVRELGKPRLVRIN
jgi:hypothetical protein